MKMAGLPELNFDFAQNFREFMLMCINGYQEK
jgi:hypothetical protein